MPFCPPVTDAFWSEARRLFILWLRSEDVLKCTPYFSLLYNWKFVKIKIIHVIPGHSDVVMGLISLNRDDIYERLKFLQNGKAQLI